MVALIGDHSASYINVLCVLRKALESVCMKYTAGGEGLTKSCVFVTGFEETRLPRTITNI